jgi:hypothetical protein
MKRTIMMIAMAITVVSCTSKSGNRVASATKVVRAHVLKVNQVTGDITGSESYVRAIPVDTIYHSGDTIRLGTVTYKLD